MGGRKKEDENSNSQPKGILKKENRITFKNLPTMDDGSDEIEPIELRGNDAEKKSESARISSRVVSAYEPCPTDTGFKTLSSLIVLKVLILDIGLSLVDVVSDFMQGHNLLQKEGLRNYGILVLGANWAPGLVAVIHMLAFYRQGFLSSENNLTMNKIKKLFLILLACFLLYPILPTIGYCVLLLNMNVQGKSLRIVMLDNLSQTAHSIAGCIEAPIQLLLTIYLILLGLLEVPSFLTLDYGKDQFENVFATFNIPMFSMAFSFVNILFCSTKVNIFNVYIVQLRRLADLKLYVSLCVGYLPFFLHSIMFRVFAFTFLLIYLSQWSAIPLLAIFFSNLIIGYIFKGESQFERLINDKYKLYNTKNPNSIGLEQKLLSNPGEDTPIWLNSFLGMFVPSCSMMGVLPEIMDQLDEEQKSRVLSEQSRSQKKILRYQVFITTSIILTSLSVIYYLVNYSEFGYNSNILTFIDFNICSALILVQAMISILFLPELDVLKLLKLTDFSQKLDQGLCKKIIVGLLFSLAIFIPPIIAFVSSFYLTLPNVYLISKFEATNQVNIEVTKSVLINNKFNVVQTIAETYTCDKQGTIPTDKFLILLPSCYKKEIYGASLNTLEQMEDKFRGISGLIFLDENKYSASALPWKFSLFREITKFPVLLVNFHDKGRLLDRSGNKTELDVKDLYESLSNISSHLYSIKCQNLTSDSSVNLYSSGGLYLGCNGSPKLTIPFNLTCRDKGRECPEQDSYEKTFSIFNPFEECDRKEGRTPQIYPGLTCTNLPILWKKPTFLRGDDSLYGEPLCIYNGNNVYFSKDSSQCNQQKFSSTLLGDWIVDTECSKSERGVKYRFARLADLCVMMEVELLRRNSCVQEDPIDLTNCDEERRMEVP